MKVKNVLSNVLTDLNENSSTCFIFSQKANNVEIIKLLRKSFHFSSSAPKLWNIFNSKQCEILSDVWCLGLFIAFIIAYLSTVGAKIEGAAR